MGPVYDDVLSMSWVFLELIVKSMALEQTRKFAEIAPGMMSIHLDTSCVLVHIAASMR